MHIELCCYRDFCILRSKWHCSNLVQSIISVTTFFFPYLLCVCVCVNKTREIYRFDYLINASVVISLGSNVSGKTTKTKKEKHGTLNPGLDGLLFRVFYAENGYQYD